MSYVILKTNGTLLTTIPDGVVDTTSTTLSLPGRNYSSYGVVMDTNFVHHLENFADSTVPANAMVGQLWFNTTANALYICPTAGETNPANWFKINSSNDVNQTVGNLTVTGNIQANNASISNNLTSANIITDRLTVNISTNIESPTMTGTSNIDTILTDTITTGSSSTNGSLTGNWTVAGNISVPTGNVSAGNIKTDNYRWANGTLINFLEAGGSENQIQYNVAGNLTGSGSLVFDHDASNLNVNANINAANYFVTSGGIYHGNASGITDVPAGNLTGTISTSVQGNITQVGTLQDLIVSGNVNAANVIATKLTGTLGATSSAQPNITSVGTLTSLGVVGNITAPNVTANTGIFSGNAAGLTNIPGANVTGTVPSATSATTATSATSATTAGTVTTAAQPNITSVGTLTSLGVTGNITSGNATLGNLASASYLSGTLLTAAQPNITSVGTLTSLGVTGNITSGNATLGNLVTANYIAGTFASSASSQPNITSVGTLTNLSVTGNISAGNVTSNFHGNGSALSSLTGANVTGTVALATTAGTATFASSATVAATVTTASQPNITSLGTLVSLGVTGNINAGNVNSNFVGNGTGITHLQGTNVDGTVALANYSSYAGNVLNLTSSQVTTALGYTPVSPSDFDQSLLQTGWTKLPNGLILQWGTQTFTSDNYVTVTFPLAFPSTCLFVSPVQYQTSTSADQDNNAIISQTITRTTWIGYCTGAGGGVPMRINWMAMGY